MFITNLPTTINPQKLNFTAHRYDLACVSHFDFVDLFRGHNIGLESTGINSPKIIVTTTKENTFFYQSGSRKSMAASDFTPEVEIFLFGIVSLNTSFSLKLLIL